MNDSQARLFAITSWGNAGVLWLAKCLNCHPQVLAIVNGRGGVTHVSKIQWPVTDYFSFLDLQSEAYRCAGDVHGVSPHEFVELADAFGDRFRGCHLIGHPLQRWWGSVLISAEMKRFFTFADFCSMWQLDKQDEKAQAALSALGPEEDYVPAHYMMHVNGMAQIQKSGKFFAVDKLAGGEKEWDRLISFLSNKEITTFGGHWKHVQEQYIGIAHQPFRQTPQELWRSLRPHHRAVFSAMLKPESRRLHEDMGYNLSFVWESLLLSV